MDSVSLSVPTHLPPKPVVAVVGCFQNGKSSLVNCLLDDFVARPGIGLATTRQAVTYRWGESTSVIGYQADKKSLEFSISSFLQDQHPEVRHFEVSLWKPLLEWIDLVDTPGFNANETDASRLEAALVRATYAVYVLTNDREINQAEQTLFGMLYDLRIPFTIILNCKNGTRWDPRHPTNERIATENAAWLKNRGFRSDPIQDRVVFPCNTALFEYASGIIEKWLSIDSENANELMIQMTQIRREVGLEAQTQQLLTLSQILPLRRFLAGNDWSKPGSNYVYWRSWFKQAWQQHTQGISVSLENRLGS